MTCNLPKPIRVLCEDPAKENRPTSTIYHAVAIRRNSVIAKGLSGDEISNLEDSHPLPSNVELVTPQINPEILSFLPGKGWLPFCTHHRQMAALGERMDVLFQSSLEEMEEVI
nr:unnamed protein product [Callosobruchus analis]